MTTQDVASFSECNSGKMPLTEDIPSQLLLHVVHQDEVSFTILVDAEFYYSVSLMGTNPSSWISERVCSLSPFRFPLVSLYVMMPSDASSVLFHVFAVQFSSEHYTMTAATNVLNTFLGQWIKEVTLRLNSTCTWETRGAEKTGTQGSILSHKTKTSCSESCCVAKPSQTHPTLFNLLIKMACSPQITNEQRIAIRRIVTDHLNYDICQGRMFSYLSQVVGYQTFGLLLASLNGGNPESSDTCQCCSRAPHGRRSDAQRYESLVGTRLCQAPGDRLSMLLLYKKFLRQLMWCPLQCKASQCYTEGEERKSWGERLLSFDEKIFVVGGQRMTGKKDTESCDPIEFKQGVNGQVAIYSHDCIGMGDTVEFSSFERVETYLLSPNEVYGGQGPSGLKDHSLHLGAFASGPVFVLYGGRFVSKEDTIVLLNGHVLGFNLLTKYWVALDTSCNHCPPPRHSHAAALVPLGCGELRSTDYTEYLIIFGGVGFPWIIKQHDDQDSWCKNPGNAKECSCIERPLADLVVLGDLWIFNFLTATWTCIELDVQPKKRFGMSFFSVNSTTFFLLGGETRLSYHEYLKEDVVNDMKRSKRFSTPFGRPTLYNDTWALVFDRCKLREGLHDSEFLQSDHIFTWKRVQDNGLAPCRAHYAAVSLTACYPSLALNDMKLQGSHDDPLNYWWSPYVEDVLDYVRQQGWSTQRILLAISGTTMNHDGLFYETPSLLVGLGISCGGSNTALCISWKSLDSIRHMPGEIPFQGRRGHSAICVTSFCDVQYDHFDEEEEMKEGLEMEQEDEEESSEAEEKKKKKKKTKKKKKKDEKRESKKSEEEEEEEEQEKEEEEDKKVFGHPAERQVDGDFSDVVFPDPQVSTSDHDFSVTCTKQEQTCQQGKLKKSGRSLNCKEERRKEARCIVVSGGMTSHGECLDDYWMLKLSWSLARFLTEDTPESSATTRAVFSEIQLLSNTSCFLTPWKELSFLDDASFTVDGSTERQFLGWTCDRDSVSLVRESDGAMTPQCRDDWCTIESFWNHPALNFESSLYQKGGYIAPGVPWSLATTVEHPFSSIAFFLEHACASSHQASLVKVSFTVWRSLEAIIVSNDGKGFSQDDFHCLLNQFGSAENNFISTEDDSLFNFGISLAISRLAHHSLILTKTQSCYSAGLFSLPLNAMYNSHQFFSPALCWSTTTHAPLRCWMQDDDFSRGLDLILRYSPLKTKEALQEEFNAMEYPTGTRFILYGLRRDVSYLYKTETMTQISFRRPHTSSVLSLLHRRRTTKHDASTLQQRTAVNESTSTRHGGLTKPHSFEEIATTKTSKFSKDRAIKGDSELCPLFPLYDTFEDSLDYSLATYMSWLHLHTRQKLFLNGEQLCLASVSTQSEDAPESKRLHFDTLWDFLQYHLNYKVELKCVPLTSDGDSFSALLGFLNPKVVVAEGKNGPRLDSTMKQDDKKNCQFHRLCETGILLYCNGRLIKRCLSRLPSIPDLLQPLSYDTFPRDAWTALTHNSLTMIINVPSSFSVRPTKEDFCFGNVHLMELFRFKVEELVKTYINGLFDESRLKKLQSMYS